MKRTSFLCLTLFLSFTLSTCDNEQIPEKIEFGAGYQVLSTDEYPSLSGDSLFVKVAYSGCENQQDFSLQERATTPSEVEVWLFKITPDQLCDAYFEEVRSFYSPEYIRNAEQIYFITPEEERLPVRKTSGLDNEK